ncbi:hypothetical protein LguiB_027265 [Lonicera macranthoides]
MAPASFDEGNSLFDFVVRDGNGVKGLVDLGVTKVPDRYIQPPQERIIHEGHVEEHYSAIDLSKLDGPDHDQVVEAIARAAETLGFFQVVNHGVPLELLESLKEAAHRFFSQPPEKKAVYLKGVSLTPLVKYGTSFVPEKEKALEWKDYISMIYTNDSDALHFWPNECKEVALEYLKKSTNMVRRIVELLMENLGVTMEEDRVDGLIGAKMVNMNFYPACPNPELTVGVGRHSDMGMLTILSNGRYKSAEHRVRTTSTESRVSIPIFTSPRPTEKISPLPELVERDGLARYREFAFADYMTNFFGKAHQGKKSLDFATTN